MNDKQDKGGRRQDSGHSEYSEHLTGGAGGDTRWQGLTRSGAEDATSISPAAINAMSPGRFDLEMLNLAAKAQFEAGSRAEEEGSSKDRASRPEQEESEKSQD